MSGIYTRVIQPFPYSGMPSFNQAIPWFYRLGCVWICFQPRIETFRVSTIQCLAPSMMTLLALSWAFVSPLLFAKSQHRYLIPFLGYTFLQQLFSYVAVLVTLMTNISTAPLMSLMTSVHILSTTRRSLSHGGITNIPNLVPHSDTACGLLLLGEVFVMGIAWYTAPRVNLSPEDILIAVFVPEAIGTATKMVMWVFVSVLSP